MSDLQRSFAKAQLAKFPPEPIETFDEQAEEEVDDLGRSSTDSSSSASSTGTIRPSSQKKLFERPSFTSVGSRSGPLPWQDFFSQEVVFSRGEGGATLSHHAYLTPPTGSGPLFVTHHGAGSSGLSFAAFSQELLKLVPEAGILSPDCRYHGETKITPTSDQTADHRMDLSLPTLSADLLFIIQSTISELATNSVNAHDIILIGHSLGGAVTTHLAHLGKVPNLLGYVVLDVVEGSAIDALQHMESYLSTRPKSFSSLTSGIEWHVRSRTIRNSKSARVSVPSLLVSQGSIDGDDRSTSTYIWRTDLLATRQFWRTWFTELSTKFLTGPAAKLLILAGTDRLDKELMIGQMQGKYQLQVVPEAGHFVHEDAPGRVAMIAADFYRRNDRNGLVLPPKVDDLIRQGKLPGKKQA